jgi:hypothetical protein
VEAVIWPFVDSLCAAWKSLMPTTRHPIWHACLPQSPLLYLISNGPLQLNCSKLAEFYFIL